MSFYTSEIARHDDSSITWRFKYLDALRFKIDIAEADMIAEWSEDYTWEKLDY